MFRLNRYKEQILYRSCHQKFDIVEKREKKRKLQLDHKEGFSTTGAIS